MDIMNDGDDDRKAGSLILRDLKLFNEATIFMKEKIHKDLFFKVKGEFQRVAESAEWYWDCETKKNSDKTNLEELWVAPPQWHAKNKDWYAWFQLERRDNHYRDSHQIADLMGVGQTEFGFRFRVGHYWFGGESAWNESCKTIDDIAQRLSERGWFYEGKGIFFRPFVLSAALIIDAWESKNADWAAILKPLVQSLDELKDDVLIFDALIEHARSKTPKSKEAMTA
ncbi:hypothetical protein CKO38_02455 [Rhodospirillum rubrum]|uniref:hypothetical protein n=1 Tax=Rhodospirillum rubrum TaxID=1085 RepID=UPI0019071217|nr:hypothetical protein [Rhodospirillum rubrum]MBK1663380.1 hypothetical protein [Rhodospirillum rubrum]MBK1675552.1 hypothetical protein [Rhodospirillum rubrum]